MPYIVVGVDGSPHSQAAFEAAVQQASFIDAEVRAIHVIMTPAFSGYELGPMFFEEVQSAAERTVGDAVEALADSYGGQPPVKITSDVRIGHIGTEMVREAEHGEGAAMVVVGSHGYGPVRSALLGSVSTYLVHHLTRPLLIIPAGDTE